MPELPTGLERAAEVCTLLPLAMRVAVADVLMLASLLTLRLPGCSTSYGDGWGGGGGAAGVLERGEGEAASPARPAGPQAAWLERAATWGHTKRMAGTSPGGSRKGREPARPP